MFLTRTRTVLVLQLKDTEHLRNAEEMLGRAAFLS